MLDFQELSNGEEWEAFARLLLEALGFQIVTPPGRGADGGQDLIVLETHQGLVAQTQTKWLVSCKHYAHSGKSVGVSDETNIIDRIRQHDCNGFLGFYSTVPSSSLVDRLSDYKNKGDLTAYNFFDKRKIEACILNNQSTRVFEQFFPESIKNSRSLNLIADEEHDIECEICSKSLLEQSLSDDNSFKGVIVFEVSLSGNSKIYHNVYSVCRGDCDRILSKQIFERGHIDGWEGLDDLLNPLIWLRDMMSWMNTLADENKSVSPEAHENMKTIFLSLAQVNLARPTEAERERLARLMAVDGL